MFSGKCLRGAKRSYGHACAAFPFEPASQLFHCEATFSAYALSLPGCAGFELVVSRGARPFFRTIDDFAASSTLPVLGELFG